MSKRPTRICLVVPAFPKLSESFIVSKAARLQNEGFYVAIACSSRKSEWKHFSHFKECENLKKNVHYLWPLHPRPIVILLLPVALFYAMAKNISGTMAYLKKGVARFGLIGLIKNFYIDLPIIISKPDILHFEFGALAKNRMHLKDLLSCKIVVSFRGHDLNFVGLSTNGYYREIFEQADMLHFLGEDLRRRALCRGYAGRTPYRLVAPAIDMNFFCPSRRELAKTDQSTFNIVSVGRLTWQKGYEFALQAVAILKKKCGPVKYRIIGDGEAAEALYFCRHQFGLEDCVEFLGGAPQPEVIKHLQWADVFLHAAVSEGFCNAVIEAQAMELPVVTSNADGLAENVEDQVTGFVVQRRNPEALAEKLFMLFHHPDLRITMGKAGRKRVMSKFALDQQIATLNDLYQDVLMLKA